MRAHSTRQRRSARTEHGAVAIMVALCMTILVVIGGMVLDFGLIRMDRQTNRLAADGAVMAGLRAADKGGTEMKTELGVCGALAFLRVNRPDFATLASTSGTLDCGSPSPTAACSNGGDAVYTGTVTLPRRSYEVTISSPFQVNDGNFPRVDDYASVSADDSASSGCDQIGVVIREARTPGLGSVATDDDLVTTVRSVGRVHIGPGSDAPAMLLLKRTGCPILQTGSAAGGSYIHVYGEVSSDGSRTQAGTIHADSNGNGCSDSILFGKGSNGIVAYAAPLLSNPTLPDPAKPGVISTVAGANGEPIGLVRDSSANVYSSAALDETGAPSATKTEPAGRVLVTRRLVDERYLGADGRGVTKAITDANAVFSTITSPAAATTAGYTVVSDCNPSGTITPPATSLGLYIDCTTALGYKGTATLDATTIIFNGKVNPQATAGTAVNMPKATKVYVFGTSADAISIGNNSALKLHTDNVDPATGNCITGTNPGKQAVMFVKNGQFKQTGGLLRMCNTTVMMLGGQSDACLPPLSYLATPALVADPPTQTPCGGGTSMGTGQFTQNGGDIDWTAPNQHDVMTLADGSPDPVKAPDWTDPDGPEDLALWTESGGNNSSTTYKMAGGGLFAVQGVFMAPNADSFILAGGTLLDLTNAQYIATSLALDGNTTRVAMRVDPNSAVTLPELTPFTLVR